MKDTFSNSDAFDQIVDSLKLDTFQHEYGAASAHKKADFLQEAVELEENIIKLTADLNQQFEPDWRQKLVNPKSSNDWLVRRWAALFSKPVFSALFTGAFLACVVLVFNSANHAPSSNVNLNVANNAANNEVNNVDRDSSFVSKQRGVDNQQITVLNVANTFSTAVSDSDITFQELWLTEDEFLFSDSI